MRLKKVSPIKTKRKREIEPESPFEVSTKKVAQKKPHSQPKPRIKPRRNEEGASQAKKDKKN